MREGIADTALKVYSALLFIFILVPIVTLMVFAFNVDRHPRLPWGGFSLKWFEAIFRDQAIIEGFVNSVYVGISVALISTVIGFATAYADYRFQFIGKNAYLGLFFMPPTVPAIILGMAMLVFLNAVGLWGKLYSVIISHVVICAPFAMALIRMRLADMDERLEAAAWNLGASEWRAVWEVILPFAFPSILAALFVSMAVSFDEFMIAWFVSGFEETLPVKVLALLQGQVSPRINAIGTVAFGISITLVAIAQWIMVTRHSNRPDSR